VDEEQEVTVRASWEHVCERPGCDNQMTMPELAATRGWFVITDRYGRLRAWCPGHN
jgi:hypothetical protein